MSSNTAATCALCKGPLPAPGDTYCCMGCARVAEILDASGFQGDRTQSLAFLQARRAGVIRQLAPPSPGSDSAGPRPEAAAPCRELAVEVEGMWCPSCGWLIETVVGDLPGVLDAQVTFLAERAEVRFDPARVEQAEILSKLTELGYPPRSDDAPSPLRGLMLRFGFAALVSANVMMLSYSYFFFQEGVVQERVAHALPWVMALLTAPVVFFAGWPILGRGWAGLAHRQPTMDSLITVAVLASLAYSLRGMALGEDQHLYFDVAASLVTFRLLGNLIEQGVFRRAAEATDAVRRLLPRKALRLRPRDGEAPEGEAPDSEAPGTSGADLAEWVATGDLAIGDRVRVAPGDRVPVDGRVLDEHATVSTAIVDGEPHPREVTRGAFVPGGSTNGATVLELEVVATPEASLLSRIADHVQDSSRSAQQVESLTDALARLMLPAVLALSLATWAAGLRLGLDFAEAFERALAVLVVSCPCALAVAAPMAQVVTASALARQGVVARGEGALELAADAVRVAFDKTGTLTRGEMELTEVVAVGISPEEATRLLASLEARTGHPIALAVCREVPEAELRATSGVRVEIGCGILGEVDRIPVRAGSPEWVQEDLPSLPREIEEALERFSGQGGSPVLLRLNAPTGATPGDPPPLAAFCFRDQARPEAARALEGLRELGLEATVLSGDDQVATEYLARELGIQDARGRLSPEEKAAWLRQAEEEGGHRPLFVGDGINDAPALAAGVGVAVSSGTDFARETASVLLLEPNLELVPVLVRAARRMRGTIEGSLRWAIGYNLVAIPLAMSGLLNPVVAAAAMIASSALVSFNALRLRRL